jgi:hypothetical protein
VPFKRKKKKIPDLSLPPCIKENSWNIEQVPYLPKYAGKPLRMVPVRVNYSAKF